MLNERWLPLSIEAVQCPIPQRALVTLNEGSCEQHASCLFLSSSFKISIPLMQEKSKNCLTDQVSADQYYEESETFFPHSFLFPRRQVGEGKKVSVTLTRQRSNLVQVVLPLHLLFTGQAALRKCFTEYRPINLPMGHPVISHSESQMHTVLRTIADESLFSSFHSMNLKSLLLQAADGKVITKERCRHVRRSGTPCPDQNASSEDESTDADCSSGG